MALPLVESSARCCWCQARLVQVASAPGIWWCPSLPCAERQLTWAISREVETWARVNGKNVPTRTWERLFVPLPRQVDYLACAAKYRLAGGAAGFGKSTVARFGLYRRAMMIPNFEALIVRETFPELEKTHLRRMAQEADLFNAKYIDSKRRLEFSNGSLIECGHLDDPAAVRKYLSTEYDHIIVDEGSTLDPSALLELSTRARTSKPGVMTNGGARFDVVSNPGGRAANVLRDLFIDKVPDADAYPQLAQDYDPSEWAFIPATLDDNPYIDPSYVRALSVLQPWRYEQLRHGNWNIFSGQFFSQWNDRRHVRDVPIDPKGVMWVRSLDWGYHDPCIVLWWAVLADQHVHCVAELKLKEHTVDAVVAEVKAMDRTLGLPTPVSRTRTYADPATRQRGGQTGESILETFGRNGMPLIPAVNERVNGWMRMQALLRDAPDGVPWLTIAPECKGLGRHLAACVSDVNNPDDIDYPDDHHLDACRYFAMSRPMPRGTVEAPKPGPQMAGFLVNELIQAQARRVLGTGAVHG